MVLVTFDSIDHDLNGLCLLQLKTILPYDLDNTRTLKKYDYYDANNI